MPAKKSSSRNVQGTHSDSPRVNVAMQYLHGRKRRYMEAPLGTYTIYLHEAFGISVSEIKTSVFELSRLH